MANAKITIHWEDQNGKKGTTTVANVNPEASNPDLKTFAMRLNGLTGNDYVDGYKITTSNLDDEE